MCLDSTMSCVFITQGTHVPFIAQTPSLHKRLDYTCHTCAFISQCTSRVREGTWESLVVSALQGTWESHMCLHNTRHPCVFISQCTSRVREGTWEALFGVWVSLVAVCLDFKCLPTPTCWCGKSVYGVGSVCVPWFQVPWCGKAFPQ